MITIPISKKNFKHNVLIGVGGNHLTGCGYFVLYICNINITKTMDPKLIELISLFLMTGVLWGPWIALHCSLHVFAKEEFMKITHAMADNLEKPMRILMPLCILFLGISVFLFSRQNNFEFLCQLGSFGCMIVTLIVTLIVELPIVKQIKQWNHETIPADWQAIRDGWLRFHTLGVFPVMISFLLYVLAILF
jgi:hypothetical protein